MYEVSIDRADERPPVRRRRAEDKETHAVKLVAEFRGRQSTIVGHDVAKMGTRGLRTRVQQPLQLLEFFAGLSHNAI
jgi:hypothetical protein